MNATLRLLWILSVTTFCLSHANAAATDTNGFRLTVELQDGSRLVGKAGDDNYQFHSDVLGEMKLPLGKIHSIECQAKTNSVKLTTSNGDVLSVQFTMKAIRIETAFGSVKLSANLLKRIQVSPMGRLSKSRPGLVALWSGEGDGDDSASGNNPTLMDISFADGQVGQAFNFNNANSSIKIAASSSLNVGAGPGFTIMAWVNPSDISKPNPITEWNNGGAYGVHFYITTTYPGNLYANIIGSDGSGHLIYTTSAVVKANVFQHVALTYDKASGVGTLYCNGAVVLQQALGSFTPQTPYDLDLGRRPLTRGETYAFAGFLDEVAIYNRALSAEEIKAIGVEENHGEPLPPPTPNMQKAGIF